MVRKLKSLTKKAGYALGGIVAAPLFGKIGDRTKSGVAVMIISILIKIVSYILYFYFRQPNVILAARLLAGIAFGAGII